MLLLAAGGLTAANAVRGPTLDAVEYSGANLVARDGQRVILRTDQALADNAAEGLRTEPEAEVDAQVDGSSIVLRFAQALRYDTDYRITLPTVRGAFTTAESVIEFEVSTPDTDVYSLVRDPDGDDELRRQGLGAGSEGSVVFASPRIQEYARLRSLIAVATLDDEDRSGLSVVGTRGEDPFEVGLPDVGNIESLQGVGDVLGFAFTAATPGAVNDALYVMNLADGSGVVNPVLGADGAPLQVLDWRFVPGTSSIVAQTYDQSLYLVDPLGETPTSPLGQHAELRGFIPGTATLIVADPDRGTLIDLTSGDVTTLELPEETETVGTTPGELVVIDDSLRYAQEFTSPQTTSAGTTFDAVVAVTDAEGTRVVFETATPASRIGRLCPSPNGQYLAIETISPESLTDGYPGLPAASAITTVFVDLDTGEATRSVVGFLPGWCR
ncbi:hypothetical protein CLV46_3070 [Diaminobutyricimonas aerilata]|uniref:Ig-like domain-containing protein n=1 Tax=Diaminobutyricimonas aerilata TaxID=1162967 RepID=A0A2M9CNM5_9MICO|nr:hypothetical protein CLV46_3070 [Diaminobutyricimonas aerilata]